MVGRFLEWPQMPTGGAFRHFGPMPRRCDGDVIVRRRWVVELTCNDLVADLDTLVTDKDRGARDQPADVVLILVAKRAAQVCWLNAHRFFPDFVPHCPQVDNRTDERVT